MTDPTLRSARRVATLVAVPVAVLAGFGAFAAFGGFDRSSVSAPSASATSASAPSAFAAPVRPAAAGAVAVAAPPLAAGTAAACRALLSRLPEALGAGPRRPVTSGAEQNAAYGDPPVVLACGFGPVTRLAPQDVVYQLSGVCWQAVELPAETAWTTVDREVPVTVTVPRAYDEPGQVVTELVPAVLAAVRPKTAVPSGCVR
ncbi:MAG TPA: DUF3515 family protein [Micromonosporaceae bacterium]|nr:DUF3515 family protein [Micromonosporaceae bacterium]